jgi:uncharacterized protein
MDIDYIFLMILVAIVVGLSKGGLGGAFASIIVPALSLAMPVQEAVALSLPFLVIGDWIALPAYWKSWDMVQVRWLLPPTIVGVLAGSFLLVNLPSLALRLIVGLLTIGIGVYKLFEKRLRIVDYQPKYWHALLTGLLSGIISSLASAGGTVLSAYLLLIRQTPRMFIGTTALIFVVSNLFRVPGLVAADLIEVDRLPLIVALAPVEALAVLAGRWMIDRINPAAFERLMVYILIISGLVLILK